jgi:hypothetical protein
MRTTRPLAPGILCPAAAIAATLACTPARGADPAAPPSTKKGPEAPTFKVDPSWPKPLPNKWLIGQVGGLAVDQHDNIWVLQRPRTLTVDEAGAAQVPPRSICCFPAPAVLEFDQQGNLLQSWGGPAAGYDWPTNEHGIWVDKQNNVWIGGNGVTDRQVLKFTNHGKFIMQIGHASSDSVDSSRTDILGQPAEIEVDDAAHEVYIADGYGNKRVIVYDSDTGAFKRMWGAYGHVPNDADPGPYDPAAPLDPQFRNPVHCVRISHDDLVYVCDRVNDRIQVFTKQGRFVKEFIVKPETLGNGSVWDLNFSHDSQQRYLVVIDGENNVVWTINRENGTIVDKQFRNGRNAGEFHWVHQMGLDSAGNLYTGEVDTSKRLQKFTPKN